MNDLQALALRDANELRRLYRRIDETLRHRSSSKEGRAAWEAACGEFHARFDDLCFPGGAEAWSGFGRGEAAFVPHALAFLEADPWSFRSGYHKQVVWRRFKRFLQSEQELQRLEQVALSYLPKRVRWEFWHMAKFVRARGQPDFWNSVLLLAASTDRSSSAVKANWLLLVRANVPVRRLIQRELLRASYQSGYTPVLDLPNLPHET